jgi:tetratricopeptide (TPR) repeat protein
VRSYVGDPETAIEHITRSMRLSPVDPQMAQLYMAMAVAMRCAKRYAESADWAQKALREVPSFLPGLISLTVAQALAGQVEEAKQTLQSALQIDPQLRLAVFSNSVFFRRPEDRDALSNGLRLAGMSE